MFQSAPGHDGVYVAGGCSKVGGEFIGADQNSRRRPTAEQQLITEVSSEC
ncbi:hypothetical protein ACFTY7_28330 [Streptomyces sp. NPDC057062]